MKFLNVENYICHSPLTSLPHEFSNLTIRTEQHHASIVSPENRGTRSENRAAIFCLLTGSSPLPCWKTIRPCWVEQIHCSFFFSPPEFVREMYIGKFSACCFRRKSRVWVYLRNGGLELDENAGWQQTCLDDGFYLLFTYLDIFICMYVFIVSYLRLPVCLCFAILICLHEILLDIIM